MDSPSEPLVERERERERVTSSPRFPRRHKILFGLVVTIGVLVYAGFNVWVYRSAKSGKAPSPKEVWQTVTKSDGGFQTVTGLNPVKKQGSTLPESFSPPSTPSPTPTPRPTGPGEYACSAEGDCNLYSDEMRKQCPATFADSRCLDNCGDASKRCDK